MIVGLLIHRNRKIAYYLEDDPRSKCLLFWRNFHREMSLANLILFTDIVQYHYGEEEEVVEPETV